jgi:hypothetical protein
MTEDTLNQRCEHPDCDQDGSPCWLPDNDDPAHPSAYYCAEHAYAMGFCWGCGLFYGGFEWFDFANPSHLCTECSSEFEDELELEDEDYEGGDWEQQGIHIPFDPSTSHPVDEGNYTRGNDCGEWAADMGGVDE